MTLGSQEAEGTDLNPSLNKVMIYYVDKGEIKHEQQVG